MKVSELEGAGLDCWVAKAVGTITYSLDYAYHDDGEPQQNAIPKYSTDWSQGGPIIERHYMRIFWRGTGMESLEWSAEFPAFTVKGHEGALCSGPTPLIAAMRAFVASKYGEEVPE